VSAARRRHWLVKSEPDVYSIDDLQRDGRTMWDGVRNYQARNLMRDDMQPGDPVLFYHSNVKPMCIAGIAEVASESYPDPTAFDKRDKHYDPKSKVEDPTWMLVDIAHVETFGEPLAREVLAAEPALSDMMLLRRGSRLSVQPVTAAEFQAVKKMARRLSRRSAGS
jgi:predicted RNA-binding protein with PUA-like domain